MREPYEFEIVGDLFAAARKYERNLVAEHQLRAGDFKVTDVDGNVLRLGGAAEHVDHLEVLTQLDQIAEILERSGAPAARRVHDVRRPRGGRECDTLVRQWNMAFRIHGVQRNIARRGGERGADQFAGEPHHQRRLVDFGAGISIQNPRIGRQYFHALRFEHDESGLVNGGDLIIGEHFHRHERIAQMPVGPRAIEDCVADVGAFGPSPAAPANRFFRLFHASPAREFGGRKLL